jgi:predicted acyl esterase
MGLIMGGFAGLANVEDFSKMLQEHPLYDAYWQSKNIDAKNIRDIPVYFTASYSTGLHTEGSLEGFQAASTPKKWIRIHASQEWHDLYTVEANDDLQRFFDFYAKGIQNDWEEDTPPVRLTLLGFENSPAKTIVERPEQGWPPARLRMEKYYLDAATKSLSSSKPDATATTAHESHSLTDSSDFKLIFPTYTELSGRPFVKLFMSAPSHDDLDVVVQIRKLSASGKVLESLNWSPMPQPQPEVPNVNVAKHLGPQGMLRASHRVSMTPRTSDDEYPSYDHRSRQPITPGEIVELLIPIWPMGVVYEVGEGLVLKIAGHDMSLPEVEMLRPTEPRDENKGQHIVHTGGEYDSYLVLPRIA